MLPVSTNISKTDWRHAVCNSFWHDSCTFCQKMFEQILNLSPHFLWKIYKLTHIFARCLLWVTCCEEYLLNNMPLDIKRFDYIKLGKLRTSSRKQVIVNSNIRQVSLSIQNIYPVRCISLNSLRKINSTYTVTHFREAVLNSRIKAMSNP